MALSDEVIARFSAVRVKSWTNPDAPAATSYDATKLGIACTDAQAHFEEVVGMVYDGLDARHVKAAVWVVRAYLLSYLDQSSADKAMSEADKGLKRLSLVTGRDRISPRGTSLLQPTVEGARGVVRPSFDGTAFNDVNLDNPSDGYPSEPYPGD